MRSSVLFFHYCGTWLIFGYDLIHLLVDEGVEVWPAVTVGCFFAQGPSRDGKNHIQDHSAGQLGELLQRALNNARLCLLSPLLLPPTTGKGTNDRLTECVSRFFSVCIFTGSHPHSVVQLRPVQRRPVRRMAGSHLYGRDQLSGPGGAGTHP